MSKLLVVEDEDKIREIICAYLNKAGYTTDEACDAAAAMHKLASESYDLILLDLMLPDEPGESLCGRIRAVNPAPVIMLTAKASIDSRIRGLSAGADDYIVKPFDPHELLARVRSVLRRTDASELLADRLSYDYGRLSIDSRSKKVYVHGQPIGLTPYEYKLLVVMARNPGRSFSREELIDLVMGLDFEGDLRTIDQHVKNLRHKIEEDPRNPKLIMTVFGTGYRFRSRS